MMYYSLEYGGWMGFMPAAVKGQSGFEYLSTYTWALLIITIVLGLLYFFTILPNAISPSYCSFQTSISCVDYIVGNIHSNTTLAFEISNLQEYPIYQPRILVNIGKTNFTSGLCAYGQVPTGGSFLCSITLPKKFGVPNGQRLQADLYLVSQYCGTSHTYVSGGKCTNSTYEYYPGILTTTVHNITNGSIIVSVYPSKPIVADNGTHDGLNATVSVYGTRIDGASVAFTVNGTGATLGSSSAITSGPGYARNYIYSTTPGKFNVTVSFSTYNASVNVTFSKVQDYSIVPSFISKTGSVGGLAGDMLKVDGKEYNESGLFSTLFEWVNGTSQSYSATQLIPSNITGLEFAFQNITACGVTYTALSGNFATCNNRLIYVYYKARYLPVGNLYITDVYNNGELFPFTAGGQVIKLNTSTDTIQEADGSVATMLIFNNNIGYASLNNANISVIKGVTSTNITLPNEDPLGEGFIDNNSYAYMPTITSFGGYGLILVNMSDGSIKQLSTSGLPYFPVINVNNQMAVGPKDRYIYIAGTQGPQSTSSAEVALLSTASNSIIQDIALPGSSSPVLLMSPNMSNLYAFTAPDYLSIINTSSNNVVSKFVISNLSSSFGPIGATAEPNNRYIYLVGSGSSRINILDLRSDEIVASAPGGPDPTGIIISPNGAFLYLPNQKANEVVMISAINYTTLNTYTDAGTGPTNGAFQ